MSNSENQPIPATPAPQKTVKSKKRRNLVLIIVLVVLILGLAGTATYFFTEYNKIRNNPELVTQQETDDLIKKVGLIITLPADETPTIASVEDKSKLSGQAFFVNAENGDKLLIYTKAQKAIIYRPSTNKIINVGPVSIDSDTSGTAQ